MAQRTDADASRDLLLGLFALHRGLIDQDKLLAAFDVWTGAQDRTMAEILASQGALDEPACVLLGELIRQHRPARAEQVRLGLPILRPERRARPEPDPAGGPPLADTVVYTRSPSPGGAPNHGGRRSAPADRPDAASSGDERFRIVRAHARGGLGEVFVAHDPELDREVAVKELQSHSAHDPISQARFLLEARLTGRLEHPGIVPVYGLGRYPDGRPYYAMRLIQGETLGRAIERFYDQEDTSREPGRREIAFRRLLRSLIDACNAVAYAHSRGVVHRDLKPENIMLGPFGETLVVDWGLAKSIASSDAAIAASPESAGPSPGDSSSLTRPGAALGTPRYMSPEQAAGDMERVGPASDVYSLGATLYCLLVGHGPFPDGDLADVLQRVRRGVFPAPRRLRRSIDPALEAICLKAMALNPEDRYDSPIAMAEEIEVWLADVRYRSEHERALGDVKRSLARLAIERAGRLFERGLHGDGMLWLARALENLPPDSPELDRAVRTSLGGWHAGARAVERCLSHRDAVHAVAFSPDGRRLATACADRTARIWDVATGSLLASPLKHEGPVRAVVFSPDGRLAATADDEGTLRLWDAVTGRPVGDAARHDAPISAVRFSPDGSRVATASRAGIPCLWEAATGRPIGDPVPWPGEPGASILAIAFHPDGTRLAVAGDDGTIGSWETLTGRTLGQPVRHDAAACALVYSPDGRSLLAGCRDGRARLRDADDGSLRAELTHGVATGAEVGCVGFAPDGRTIATACADGTARLWDVATGRPIGEPLAHRGSVDRLAFHPGGSIVATAGRDGTARLWDTGTGLAIGPPLEHRGAVHALAFSPDGRRLATASADAMARCWRVPSPVAGDCERITCWVRLTTEREFDEGDAIRPADQLVLWELRRLLQDLGGPPVKALQEETEKSFTQRRRGPQRRFGRMKDE
jgi:WD40 repeat protein/serine/threonine protein kinase